MPFILCLIVVLAGPSVGIPYGHRDEDRVSDHGAVWWVAFSVPLSAMLHQTHYERAPRLIPRRSLASSRTLKRIWMVVACATHASVLLLSTALHTIRKMSTSYSIDLWHRCDAAGTLLVTRFMKRSPTIAYGLSTRFGRSTSLTSGNSYRRYFCITIYRGVHSHYGPRSSGC